MQPIPKRKADDLGREIEAFAWSTAPDQFTFRRLERECLQLTQLSSEFAADGHVLLGILYASMGMRDESVNHFDLALHWTETRHISIKCNKAVACLKVGLFQHTAEIVRETENLTNDPVILKLLLISASRCGLYVTAHRLLERLGKMKTDKTLHECHPHVPVAAELLATRKLTEQDMLDRQAVAAEAVFSICGVIWETNVVVVDNTLAYAFIVKCRSMDKLLEANWVIAEQLTTQFDDSLSDIITFSTLPYSEQQ
jgi:hypothetical protein